MTSLGIGLCIAAGLTVAAAAIWVTEQARARRHLLDWWDIPFVAFGVYFAMLAVIGWCWCLVSAVTR